jgi:hypothetical protein
MRNKDAMVRLREADPMSKALPSLPEEISTAWSGVIRANTGSGSLSDTNVLPRSANRRRRKIQFSAAVAAITLVIVSVASTQLLPWRENSTTVKPPETYVSTPVFRVTVSGKTCGPSLPITVHRGNRVVFDVSVNVPAGSRATNLRYFIAPTGWRLGTNGPSSEVEMLSTIETTVQSGRHILVWIPKDTGAHKAIVLATSFEERGAGVGKTLCTLAIH